MKIARILSSVTLALGLMLAPTAASSVSDGPRRLAGGNAACGSQRVRKAWVDMSSGEQSLYVQALQEGLKRGIVEDFAAIHVEDLGSDQAHHSALRDMDPKFACVTLPYYDVHSAYADSAAGKCSSMFDCSPIFNGIGGSPQGSKGSVQVNGIPADGVVYNGAPFDAMCDDNNQCGLTVRNDLTQRPVPSGAGFTTFMDLVTRSQDFATFLEGIQFGLHNDVHNAIGGIMTTFASPRDVVFYSWHSAIDMFLHVYHTCRFGVPVTEAQAQSSLEAFSQAFQSCGGITGVDANTKIVMRIRYNGQMIDAADHPTLGKYLAYVGDVMGQYGDITKLDDYSYTYQVSSIYQKRLLGNKNICKQPHWLLSSHIASNGAPLYTTPSAGMPFTCTEPFEPCGLPPMPLKIGEQSNMLLHLPAAESAYAECTS
ncbi:TPA: hypothetical protein N0F65_010645 [Lagenidium giganteum]|uniref:Tyrosinase copper-binding domain-containing protein n=1 Tax=Lagenidium giganteum TaxID=4803 RepID=A0AAV2ZEZ8_9STRA|nr:TPA: hypothetical protein N0F65_010645 [Lagenidium giganteum]